jgi:hypothetical protein
MPKRREDARRSVARAQVVLLRLAGRLTGFLSVCQLYEFRDRQRAISAKLAVKPEETVMLQTVSPLLPELALLLMTAVATHLVMSFAQTLMHYKLGHHPMGGKFFRNHINFHHT